MNQVIDPVEMGRRIRKLRDIRPRTKIAQAMGISYSALCKYETGCKVPCDRVKVLIANFYGVTVQQLFYDPKYSVSE